MTHAAFIEFRIGFLMTIHAPRHAIFTSQDMPAGVAVARGAFHAFVRMLLVAEDNLIAEQRRQGNNGLVRSHMTLCAGVSWVVLVYFMAHAA